MLPVYRGTHRIDIRGFSADLIEETIRSIDNTRNGARELRSSVERTIREFMFELLCSPEKERTGWLDLAPGGSRQLILLPQPNQTKEFHSWY